MRDLLHLVAEERHAVGGLGARRLHLDNVALDPEAAAAEHGVVADVLALDEHPQHLVTVVRLPHLEHQHALAPLLGRAQAVDARHRGHHDHVAPCEQRRRGAEPQTGDVVVLRRVLLDVEIGLRHVGLRLVVVVVGDEVLDRVPGEELAELVAELRGERLVVRDHERRPLELLDRPGHRGGLPGTGRAQDRLEAVPGRDRRGDLADRPRLVAGGPVVRGDPQLAHSTQRTHAVRSSHGRISAAAGVAFRPLRGRRRRGRRLRGKLGGGRPSRCPAVSGAGAGARARPGRVERALAARQDVWGNELLRSRVGPDLRRRAPLPATAAACARTRWPSADRVGRPLPRVRAPGRAAGLRLRAAPRRRRQSDRLPALAGLEAHDPRRAWRTRAIRLVPLPSCGSTACRAATCRSCKPHTPTQQAPATGRSRSSRRSRGVTRWRASCGSPSMLAERRGA